VIQRQSFRPLKFGHQLGVQRDHLSFGAL
jgi:hypothetical protein